MTEIDSQILLLINGLHTGYLDQLMWLISGKLVWIPFYIITLFAIYQKRGWQGALHLLLLVGVMMLFTDMVNSQVIRPWFHRLRPANLENPLSQYVHIVNDYRGGSYGFPSAHAANYWGLSLLVAYFMKSKRVLYSLFSLSLIVCYSRSYLGVHYPGDLLGGHRAGSYHDHSEKSGAGGQDLPRLSVLRLARNGQDELGEDSRPRGQLPFPEGRRAFVR